MLDDKKTGLAPKQGYHAKTQRFASRIHYTVTPIDSLADWKAEQAQKQAEWDAGRPKRYAAVREHVVEMVLDEAKRKQALREQNKRSAGVTIDRLDAEALVKAPKNDAGLFMYTPDAPSKDSKRSLIARLKDLFK